MSKQSQERWRQIVHPTHGRLPFDVSSHGQIRRRSTKHVLRPFLVPRVHRRAFSYCRMVDGRRLCSTIYIGSCVARAFKRPKRPGEMIEHLDQNKQNDRNDNLRWMSLSQNVTRSFAMTNRQRVSTGSGWWFSKKACDTILKLLAAGYSQVRVAASVGANNCTISKLSRARGRKYGKRPVVIDWSKLTGTDDKLEVALAVCRFAAA